MGAHLSEPIVEKENEEVVQEDFRVAVTSMQGWRNSMEDSHCFDLKVGGNEKAHLFAVFDGHGGREVALYAARHLSETLAGLPEFKAGDYEEALRRSFLVLDEQLRTDQARAFMQASKDSAGPPPVSNEIKMIEEQIGVKVGKMLRQPEDCDAANAGCTAVAVLIVDGKYYVANAGDSRASLCRGGASVELTRDHNPELQSEIDRIAKAGGIIERGRVNGNLNLTRALGDLCYKTNPSITPEEQIITANPDVSSLDRHTDDQFLVLACDGIWESRTSKQVQDFIKQRIDALGTKQLTTVGNTLCDALLSPSVAATDGIGCDNMTVMIVDLMRTRRDENGKPPGPTETHSQVQLNLEVGKDGNPLTGKGFEDLPDELSVSCGGA